MRIKLKQFRDMLLSRGRGGVAKYTYYDSTWKRNKKPVMEYIHNSVNCKSPEMRLK